MLNRFFIVLTITPSFLVRFLPVKCRIEALIMLFRTVRERSVRFSFWSGQRFGQTLVKLGQAWSNLVKTLQALGNVSRTTFRGFLGMVHPVRVGNGLVKPWSTLGQPRSNLVKLGQSSRNSGKCVPDHVLRLFGAINLRRIRLTWFGLPRFACRHPRKSCGKKWGYDNIYKYVINVNKAINELKTRIFQWVQCLWNYMVVKASLRSHIIHHDQSGLSRPNHKEEGRNNNIHNVVK